MAVDALRHLLALHVAPATSDHRTQVGRPAQALQAVTGYNGELAWVDHGYGGDKSAAAARAHGMALEVVKLSDAKRGFVLLPRRRMVERSCAWSASLRRLARGDGRLP